MPVNTLAWNRIRYSLYAPIYDLTERFLNNSRHKSHQLASIKPGERVLLMGCGTGQDLDYLPNGVDVVAVDLSPAMTARCQMRADSLGMKILAEVMNAEQLSLEPDQFDAVILHLVLAVIPDPDACLREAARVLKTNGRISIFDKFVPAGQRPSLVRRGVNLITNLIFSDITRSLEPLLDSADLYLTQDQPGLLGGSYRSAIAKKIEGRPQNPSIAIN